jgi:hypothetical protein
MLDYIFSPAHVVIAFIFWTYLIVFYLGARIQHYLDERKAKKLRAESSQDRPETELPSAERRQGQGHPPLR